MGISDTSCMIDGLPLLYWRWNLGKSGQSMCHDFTPQLWHDVTPRLRLTAKRWVVDLTPTQSCIYIEGYL